MFLPKKTLIHADDAAVLDQRDPPGGDRTVLMVVVTDYRKLAPVRSLRLGVIHLDQLDRQPQFFLPVLEPDREVRGSGLPAFSSPDWTRPRSSGGRFPPADRNLRSRPGKSLRPARWGQAAGSILSGCGTRRLTPKAAVWAPHCAVPRAELPYRSTGGLSARSRKSGAPDLASCGWGA